MNLSHASTLVSLPLALLAALSAACGGETTFTPSGTPDDSASTLPSVTPGVPDDAVSLACNAQSAANCALRDSCTDGFANQLTYGSADLCVSQATQGCIANMGAIGTGNSTAHINGCAAAYPTEWCTDYWDGNTVPACRSAEGVRANGAGCGVNSQCSSGFCDVGADAECGTCAPLPSPGDPCRTSSNCVYGLSCPIVAPATSGVCTVRGTIGSPCDDFQLCQGGLTCIGANTSAAVLGTCQEGQTTVGAACNTQTGPGCDGEIYLHCSAGTCQREIVASAGQPCGDLAGLAYAQCGTGGLCVKPLGSSMGTCVGAAANGAACDSVAGPPCLSPAKCIAADGGSSGTCVFPDPASCG